MKKARKILTGILVIKWAIKVKHDHSGRQNPSCCTNSKQSDVPNNHDGSKAEAGSTVYIFNGVTLIGKTVTDSYGNFKAAIRAQKTGTILAVATMDKAGNQSKLVSVKVY